VGSAGIFDPLLLVDDRSEELKSLKYLFSRNEWRRVNREQRGESREQRTVSIEQRAESRRKGRVSTAGVSPVGKKRQKSRDAEY
jgi:hypothetical protein